MNVLIVAATDSELNGIRSFVRAQWIEQPEAVFTHGSTTCSFLVTGPGMIRTAATLGAALAHSPPDLCLNVGIAGAYPGKFAIGEVVHVTEETVASFGAEDADGAVLAPGDIGLPFDLDLTCLINQSAGAFDFLPKANGLTVNLVSGSASTIASRTKQYRADIETMEGAAFFYCCLKAGVEFIEIRAISNIVEPRNRENWKIDLALKHLDEQVIAMLSSFP